MRFMRWLCIMESILLLSTIPACSQVVSTTQHWSVKQLIEFHKHMRPELQVQDVYKMLYQANFGLGHLLTDEVYARTVLDQELARLDATDSSEELLERISTGGEVVRVNLRPFKKLNLDAGKLIQVMVHSAAETIPDTLAFYREWNEFAALVRYDLLNFPLKDVEAWDARVSSGNLLPDHHSETYTELYKPAYRVVRRHLFESAFSEKEASTDE
jgi:hypothetical protein